ncbi:transposon Ty3-I Gag-Pol polyprotein [Trichonephila clavata]|uniref:Transposon Ty3-I Gag-Pol polyprotein n=1 Tax=Trichonephila clavata TaxID=2740835 RepID=A0A8X6KCS6_TRICU|nr:transposon Ty3-I Gag-Pol polyprotein [Trichonephila clavata]
MVLQCIRNAGLTLNHKKCRFGQRSLNILGHLVDKDGIRPDPGKIEAVRKSPTPQTVSQVRSGSAFIIADLSIILPTSPGRCTNY